MPIALAHAVDLHGRGLAPIPVPYREKAPRIPGWQKIRLAREQLPTAFAGEKNIGVLWGEPSGSIIDVDLDHPRAVELADSFLPHTAAVFGRPGKPRSHRLYRVDGATTKKWAHATAGMLVELRSTGTQTIAPGSVHPSGEIIAWHTDGEPATIGYAELVAACEALSAAVIADLFPPVPAPTPQPLPAPRTTHYGAAALRDEYERVARAAEGTRNHSLNHAAFRVGQLVAGNEIDADEALAALSAAARVCGLPDREAAATIASGLRGGASHPRTPPPPPPLVGSELWRLGATPPAQAAPATVPAEPIEELTAADLSETYPELREPVIHGLLRRGEVMNVIAGPKIRKSWLIHALAIEAARGGTWMEHRVEQGRTLIIDGELHRETLASRLRAVGRACAATREELARVSVWARRGTRANIDSLAAQLAAIEPGTYGLIVLDALYRFLPPGVEENSNEGMASVYNTLDYMASVSGACIVAVHHASKGDQSGKSVTDVGSGAGAQSRAADTHLVLRAHEEEDAVAVDAVVRSFAPVRPFCMRFVYPAWQIAPDLDPKALAKPNKPRLPAGSPAPLAMPGEEPASVLAWTPATFAAECVGPWGVPRAEAVRRGRERGMSAAHAERLFAQAAEAGLLTCEGRPGTAAARWSCTKPLLGAREDADLEL